MKKEGYSSKEIRETVKDYSQYKIDKFKSKPRVGRRLDEQNNQLISEYS